LDFIARHEHRRDCRVASPRTRRDTRI
jgi:hypothetical protein